MTEVKKQANGSQTETEAKIMNPGQAINKQGGQKKVKGSLPDKSVIPSSELLKIQHQKPEKKRLSPLAIKKILIKERTGLNLQVQSPLWISVSEAAALGGVQHKTIRRAIKDEPLLSYRIVKDRYQIELGSLINFLHKNIKLYNKLLHSGLGQYVEKWKNY